MKKSMLFEAVAVLFLIFLVFLMYVMVTPNSSTWQKWALSGVVSNASGGVYNNMFIGNNGTVYTVNGTNVNAISPDGRLLWSMAIPDLLNVSSLNGTDNDVWSYLKAVTDNETLYLELSLVNTQQNPMNPQQQGITVGYELLAISSQGNLIWGKPFTLENSPQDFCAKGGYLYIINSGVLTVYNTAGIDKWGASNVNFLPIIGDNGTVFILKGITGYELDIYAQNGYCLSDINTSDYGMGGTAYGSPYLLYNNHIIYLPLQGGLIALYENGSLKWKYSYNNTPQSPSALLLGISMYGSAPFDAEGDIYLQQGSRVFYISPDGVETTVTNNCTIPLDTTQISLENGVFYNYQAITANNSNSMEFPASPIEDSINGIWALSYMSQAFGNRTLDQLNDARINAISIANGNEEWNYTLPLEKQTTTLTQSNYMGLVPYSSVITNENTETPEEWYQSHNITFGKKIVVGTSYLDMATYNSTLYVNFWTFNYMMPTFFGQSECTYAGGIYAIGKNGTLLWYTPTDSMVSSMQENNGTIYYSTLNGKLYSSSINAVAGLVVTAALYIFLGFFLAGAVVRARNRIDSNKNRNLVLKFINDNPGVSLYDIMKILKINKGTVRYHLMILGLNHRITSYKADDKYVRYFTNAGSYSAKQQLILALMRRDGINKVLNCIVIKPGLTNIELAGELGMKESSTIRYLKELLANCIVTKEKTQDGRQTYFINDAYKDDIEFAIRVFHKTTVSFHDIYSS